MVKNLIVKILLVILKLKMIKNSIDYENSFLKNIKYEYENDPKPTEETIVN